MLFMVSIFDSLAWLFYHFHLAPWHPLYLGFLPAFWRASLGSAVLSVRRSSRRRSGK